MISNSKNAIILILSLTISLFNACCNNNGSNAEKIDQIQNNTTKNLLTQNASWIKLCKIWKELNKLESDSDPNIIRANFKNVEVSLPKANSYIDVLFKEKLITEEQKEFLLTTISQRIGYIEYQIGFVSCYDMSQLGFEIVKRREDLEKRYDILEKLFKENKIGSDAFELARQKIDEDMSFIEQNNYSASKKPYNKDLTNLLIYLNK